MIIGFNYRPYFYFLLSVLSGVLLFLSYPPYSIKFLIWIALIPLLIFLYDKRVKGKSAFWGGYLTGFIFFALITGWFLFASMANWTGPGTNITIIAILISTWLLYVIFASFFNGFAAYLFFNFKNNHWFDVLLFPSLWVISEYLRAWAITFFTLGQASLLGPHFTLGDLGYALADSPFVVLGRIAGIYGLSFLVVGLNCLIFFAIKSFKKPILKRENMIKLVFFFLVFLLIFISNHYLQNFQNQDDVANQKSIPVSVVQTNFPSLFSYTQEQEKEFYDVETNLLNQIAQQKEWPRLVVLPEHANLLKESNIFSSSSVTEIFGQKQALIIDSGWQEDQQAGTAVTRLDYFDVQKAKIVASFDKMLLMPVGDYLPYFLIAALNLTGHENWLVNMDMTRGYEKGHDLTVVDYQGTKFGSLMCSEIISPYLYKDLTAKGAEVLISVASDAVFKGDQLLLSQLLAIGKVRAAENNRYLIEAANEGNSYVINNLGKVTVKSEKIGNQVINAEVKPISGRTFYNYFGDWILILSLLIISLSIFFRTNFYLRR